MPEYHWVKVDKHTRAYGTGQVIQAPCGAQRTVFHMAWCALGCDCDVDFHPKTEYFALKRLKTPTYTNIIRQELEDE